jgi:excisionase family DNA binding protein
MTTATDFRLSDLMSFEECAAALGVSRRAGEDAVKRGDLTSIKIAPRCVRVSRSEFVDFLKKRRKAGR